MTPKYRSFANVADSDVSDYVDIFLRQRQSCELDQLVQAIAKRFSCDASSTATRKMILTSIDHDVKLGRIQVDGTLCSLIGDRQGTIQAKPAIQRSPDDLQILRQQIAQSGTRNVRTGRQQRDVIPDHLVSEAKRLLKRRMSQAKGRLQRSVLVNDAAQNLDQLLKPHRHDTWAIRKAIGQGLENYMKSGAFVEHDDEVWTRTAWGKRSNHIARTKSSVWRVDAVVSRSSKPFELSDRSSQNHLAVPDDWKVKLSIHGVLSKHGGMSRANLERHVASQLVQSVSSAEFQAAFERVMTQEMTSERVTCEQGVYVRTRR